MEKENTPLIKAIPNGPYRLKNIPFLIGAEANRRIELKKAILCRCGASKEMPFCDGKHTDIGFSTEGESVSEESREKAYRGEGITVHYDAKICAHVGICVRELPEVFDVKKRPWIDPDKAEVGRLIEIIRKCPAGALSYTVNGVRVDSFESELKVEVVKNGPLNVYGGIELQGARAPKVKDHYSLCRCGKSENTPFCDGSHHGKFFD